MTKPGYLDRTDANRPSDRRSSVRVQSLLPCRFRKIDEADVPEIESRILDLAVVESDNSFDEQSKWDERNDDLSREAALMLNEVRALRRKLTELQRVVERGDDSELETRWITINDQGFLFEPVEGDPAYEEGDLLEVKLELPNVQTREILAIGRVIRLDYEDDASETCTGVAIEFKSISQIHEDAIMRYALLRERQEVRSDFSSE